MAPRIGVAGGVPILLKVAKLETSLDVGGAVPDIEVGDINFDKQTDEVVLIYGADLHARGINGMGTGTELDVVLSRDSDQATVDFDDEDTMIAWHTAKSFVTSGMAIVFPNSQKIFNNPLITSRSSLRVVAEVSTAIWSNGLVNVYVYYTTRKLDLEARRVLIGVE